MSRSCAATPISELRAALDAGARRPDQPERPAANPDLSAGGRSQSRDAAESRGSDRERLLWTKQAQHQRGIGTQRGSQVVEVARLGEHALLLEQVERPSSLERVAGGDAPSRSSRLRSTAVLPRGAAAMARCNALKVSAAVARAPGQERVHSGEDIRKARAAPGS